MKKTLLLLICLIFLYSCEDDYIDSNSAKNVMEQSNGAIKNLTYLKGVEAQQAINALKLQLKQTNAPVSNYSNATARMYTGWEIDFSEIMYIADTTGYNNYTFRVNHPDIPDNVFYNLVYTEKAGNISIRLLRYQMSDKFAANFYYGNATINQFRGKIIISHIIDTESDWPTDTSPPPVPSAPTDPCEDDVVIDLPDDNPPGGGGPGVQPGNGTTAPGAGDGPAGGNGGPDISISTGADCIEVALTPCSEHQHWGYDPDCQAATQGGVYIWNSCTGDEIFSGRMSSAKGFVPNASLDDPCAPGGGIGIFGPLLAKRIVKEITDTNLDPCSKNVLAELKTLSEKNMATIIAKLDNSPSVYKTDIRTESFPTSSGELGQTRRNVDANNTPVRYDYIVRLQPEYTANATKLSLAATILHELIHGYFLTLVDDQATGTNPNAFDEFPILFEAYVTKTFGPNLQLSHHIEMAEKYVDVIARALQEYQTGIPVADGVIPDQIYTDLAWGGLSAAPVYLTLHQTDRDRIANRYAAEARNEIRGTQNPIGAACH